MGVVVDFPVAAARDILVAEPLPHPVRYRSQGNNALRGCVGIPKILLVEDEALLKLPIEDALSDRGYACLYASTLDGALEILKTEQVSAAILDVNIRGAAVFSVAREVKAQGAPCVFTTGYTDAAIPPEFADAPYFKKPYNLDLVIDAVAACVRANNR